MLNIDELLVRAEATPEWDKQALLISGIQLASLVPSMTERQHERYRRLIEKFREQMHDRMPAYA